MMAQDDWPFDQPRNCATFTQRQIMAREKPILRISHDADDHGWQFLDGGVISMQDAMLVSLTEIVELDPSMLAVADLDPGWTATRSTPHASWHREQNQSSPDA